MCNSCGADGPGVTRLQSLWISVPITHLAPVAISPRALWWWWRRLPRPLRPGAWVFFFFSSFFSPWLRVPPVCLTHECALPNYDWLGTPEPSGFWDAGLHLCTPFPPQSHPAPPPPHSHQKSQAFHLSLCGPQMRFPRGVLKSQEGDCRRG